MVVKERLNNRGDYKVVRLSMDVAIPEDSDINGIGNYNFRGALEKALKGQGCLLVGDAIDIQDVTNNYSDFNDDDDDFDYEAQLRDYYNEYIRGKNRDEIPPERLDVYSDLYKDVYGVRPRFDFLG